MDKACARAEQIFTRNTVRLTLGGEPTYVPLNPEGAEWSYSAVGPTKLAYAWKVAAELQKTRMPGAAAFYCPGKSYPGEVNPRWVIKLLANRNGTPLYRSPVRGRTPTTQTLQQFADGICKTLGVPSHWLALSDPQNPRTEVLAMPLDHDKAIWRSARWPLEKKSRVLSEAEGPAGLRLPLNLLPPSLPRRALTVERTGNTIAIFFPPLLQKPFLELLSAVEIAGRKAGIARVNLQGYIPSDEACQWTSLGLAADPGVLEINLPACVSWRDYAGWIESVTDAAEKCGLRSWKENLWEPPQGTGGGNHLLWGGPSLEEHPFFTRPAWLASILRYWQHHPALGYLFTGCYVGASSQAPRPDESARDLYDIEMAYSFLESLPEG
ncbi:MAG TPA: transglutaminase family protein, partial [Chthoniobacterales bacterium]